MAAGDTAQAAVSEQLIIVVGGVVTAAIVALSGVLVAVVNRGGKAAPAPTHVEHELYERTAVLRQRADDSDERFDVIDRARAKDRADLDAVLGILNRREDEWRGR